ncbi:MAG: hypothetical protein AB1898_11110 [Acidobacteriota bacterium]
MRRKQIFLYLLYTTVLAITTFLARASSAEQTVIVPLSPSLKQVSLYLDRSSSELDLFLELVQKGESAAARVVLSTYTREVSSFHVALGRLRVGKPEREFVLAVLERLQLQRIGLQNVSQKGPSEWKVVSKEAKDHLESALRMAEQKLEKHRFWGRLNLKRSRTDRADSWEREKLKAARAAASLDASQSDGLKTNGRAP